MACERFTTQTAAIKVKLPCPADNCDETRASKQTLSKHMLKANEGLQQGVQQGVQTLKNFLISPMTRPSSSPGPATANSSTTAMSAAPATTTTAPATTTTASTSAPSTTSGLTSTPARLLFSQIAEVEER